MTTKANTQAPIAAGEKLDMAPRELSGMCLFQAVGGGLEVELLEVETYQRSVVYLRDGSELVLFVPKGCYGIWLRQLHPQGRATLRIVQMSVLKRLVFFTRKLLSLLRRGPVQAVTSIAGFWRRKGRLTAASFDIAPSGADLPVEHREFLPPMALTEKPSVSIIIPTKVHAELLESCVNSLGAMEDAQTELIIVDNGAVAPDMLRVLDDLRGRENTQVLRLDIPFNFSRLCNAGARLARHECLLFLNDDIEAMDADWLNGMLGYATRPDVGVVGARLLYPSGLLQHAGIAANLVPGPGHPFRLAPRDVWSRNPLMAVAGEVDAVTGACLMIRASLFEALGGFNEDDFAISLNDVDLCLRVREQGLKVIYAPQATLIHKESQSRRDDDHPAERARRQTELKAFYRRHGAAARHSCFYPEGLRRDTDRAIKI
ncbi:glycosyltransferase family 2 protein [Asticcacaulis taihuensis]|uniref:Glycosyltransferase, GT2 family n=1 Tax=Asticcacaulis taihuensis TaxID=260084 RepID=A0A1G4SEM2_9CAUL|nr:glycosyltransferase family 2 protein [Asticcacaulis taihuensis]SCW67662.1 Glycosyltransferase, GT2 family [Asticcacaulis taihuensis]